MKKLNIRKSTVLTTINSVGVIVTAVLSSGAALKAKKKLDEQEESLTTKKKIKLVVPYYIPTAISGAVTIGAGIAANKIDGAALAAMGVIGAKAVQDFKDYRDAVVMVDGPEHDQQILDYLENRNLIEDQNGDLESRYWFYDPWCDIWFEASKSDVANGWAELNRVLSDPNATGNYGMPTMSDFYTGCDRIEYINETTDSMGWIIDDLNYNCDSYGLYFYLSRCDDNGEIIRENLNNPSRNNGETVKYRMSTFWEPRPIEEIKKELIQEGYWE